MLTQYFFRLKVVEVCSYSVVKDCYAVPVNDLDAFIYGIKD